MLGCLAIYIICALTGPPDIDSMSKIVNKFYSKTRLRGPTYACKRIVNRPPLKRTVLSDAYGDKMQLVAYLGVSRSFLCQSMVC